MIYQKMLSLLHILLTKKLHECFTVLGAVINSIYKIGYEQTRFCRSKVISILDRMF